MGKARSRFRWRRARGFPSDGRARETSTASINRWRGLAAGAEHWLAARNAVVEALHGFVVALARRVPTWHVPFEDRIQAGGLAVTVALERFDPARGTRLTTYLGNVVERAMRRLGRQTPRS